MGLHYDADGQASELQLGSTVTGEGELPGLDLEQAWFADPDAALDELAGQQIAELGVDATDARFVELEATASLDLTDPEVGTTGEAVFDALASGDTAALGRAGGDLVDHLRHDTDVGVTLDTGSADGLAVEAEAGGGLAFGFEAGHERREQELAAAWHRPPGGSWREAVCA